MTKKFTLLQLFSIVDGRLSTEMGDVYDMLNHITDQELMTHHLPVALDYIKEKNPTWFVEVDKKIKAVIVTIPYGHEVMTSKSKEEQFKVLMNRIKEFNEDYDIPQLKDEFDTLNFGDFMINNSLLLKKANS